ncbi:MAG: peptide-methionine (S)-S-oxide reductase [Phascolarctobacterium sp.]|nr:peptide-methionine (S)-S-oxide reductase [Phascolarctobacterium sp.]
MKSIILSGISVYDLQEAFSRYKGVVDTKVGYVNSDIQKPSLEELKSGKTGAALGVKITYNPNKIDICDILALYFKMLRPKDEKTREEQARDLKRSCIFYYSGEDVMQIEYYVKFMQNRGVQSIATTGEMLVNDTKREGPEPRYLYVNYVKAVNFIEAPEEEQNYLRKNPDAPREIDLDALAEDGFIAKL